MSTRRPSRSTAVLAVAVASILVQSGGLGRAQEPAAPAAAPAPAPAKPDPALTPAAGDPTGSAYTGASSTAALTGEKDAKTGRIKSTPESIEADVKQLKIAINMFWILVTGFLVMFMQAGFALVETGLTRAKNATHTMGMNAIIYAIGVIGFWACGFALMFGGLGPVVALDGPNILDRIYTLTIGGQAIDLIGYKGFFLGSPVNDASILTLFLFQMVFMDTAATIPTGTLAERWKFSAFVAYGFFMAMIIYPVFGCWVWGGGWLADLGTLFGLGNGHVDFAGSSVVHMTGGVTALAGALILGPRIGKYNRDGTSNPIPPHNIPMVVLGTLVLAFGWFGFNPGSSLAATDLRIGSIATCTMLASGAGALTCLLYMWSVYGKPDIAMACNGMLAGLVAITAPCAFVNPVGAVFIGAVAGVLVVWSCLFVEKVLRVDDPAGAISVHGVCGAWGCLSIGLFADGKYGMGWNGVADKAPIGIFYDLKAGLPQLAAEAIGVSANFIWVFSSALIAFLIIEKVIGNRVTAHTEIEGLDIEEMGVTGYINDDTHAVRSAGREHISIHGPGVPVRTIGNGRAGSKAPVGPGARR